MFRYLAWACLWAAVACLSPGIARAEEGVFTVSTSYKSLLSNPEQKGMLDRLVKEAFRRIGRRAAIVFSATERSLVDVNAGLLDAEINRVEGMESQFPNLVRVPEPNMTMHFVAFAKKPLPLAGWKSLSGLQIGLVRGWKILERHTAGFERVTLVPTETELFTMLHKNRIDVALYDKLTGYEQLHRRGLAGIRHLEPPLASRDMFLYLNRRHATLAEPLAGALQAMKRDGTYARIVAESTAHLVMDGR